MRCCGVDAAVVERLVVESETMMIQMMVRLVGPVRVRSALSLAAAQCPSAPTEMPALSSVQRPQHEREEQASAVCCTHTHAHTHTLQKHCCYVSRQQQRCTPTNRKQEEPRRREEKHGLRGCKKRTRKKLETLRRFHTKKNTDNTAAVLVDNIISYIWYLMLKVEVGPTMSA